MKSASVTENRKLPLLSGGREVETAAKRSFQFDRAAFNKETRTVDLSFSSTAPVDRWYGREILDHSPGACDLSRLNSGGPLLVNHDRDCVCGVVESAKIDGEKGRAIVRFSKSEDGEEMMQDVMDGIRRNVSVTYEVREMVLESEKEGVETYRVTRWTPLEISIVSIPADTSVGVGRSLNQSPKEKIMPEIITPPAAPVITLGEERKTEQKRCAEIMALAKQHKRNLEEAESFIADGKDAREYADKILTEYRTKPAPKFTPDIGLNEKEIKRYSFMRAIRALANPNDKAIRADAAFEMEVSEAASKKMERATNGLLIPTDLLIAKRDLTVGTAADGGYLRGTDHLGSEFIDILRNRMVVRRAGARVLTGLRGNIDIPKRTSGAAAYWVAENAAITTEGTNVYDQILMAPNTVGSYVDIGRRLLIQSDPSVEQLVREDIAISLALAIDLAALHGAGGNEPTGVAATSGIGAVVGGTNGAYPTWDHIVDLETEVAIDNADVMNMAYITNAKVRGRLKKSLNNEAASGVYLWQDGDTPGEGMLNGYRALVSNQVSSALTKGGTSAASAIFFGDWSQLIIGEWGTLELIADKSSLSTAGGLRLVALQEVDVAVRYPQSFAAMLDALTA